MYTWHVPFEWYSPHLCLPPHGVSQSGKYSELRESIKTGWQNGHPPVVGYWNGDKIQLLTGSHRWEIAMELSINLPVIIRDNDIINHSNDIINYSNNKKIKLLLLDPNFDCRMVDKETYKMMIKLNIDTYTTEGEKKAGDIISLPLREAAQIIKDGRGQMIKPETKKILPFPARHGKINGIIKR